MTSRNICNDLASIKYEHDELLNSFKFHLVFVSGCLSTRSISLQTISNIGRVRLPEASDSIAPGSCGFFCALVVPIFC